MTTASDNHRPVMEEEETLGECAEVLIDGVPDSPVSSHAQGVSVVEEAMREPSYPITPTDNEDSDSEGGRSVTNANRPTTPPTAEREPAVASSQNASAQVGRASTAAATGHDRLAGRPPRKNPSRLYTPPPNAVSPNYGKVLSFTEEEARERQRAERRRSASRSVNGSEPRANSQQPPVARRASRLQDSVPRGPAPNYGTVLRFDDTDKQRPAGRRQGATQRSESGSVNAAGRTSDSPAAPSADDADSRRKAQLAASAAAEERARRLERLSRPRQVSTPGEATPAPNLLHARKAPARTASAAYIDRLAAPRKREMRPEEEEEVISTPTHPRRTTLTHTNRASVDRLSQPRQRHLPVSRDPVLSRVREESQRSSYGGTTAISLPSQSATVTSPTHEDPEGTHPHGRRPSAAPVSWEDMKPAPRPNGSLAARLSLPATPRGSRSAVATRAAPPLGKPPAAPRTAPPEPPLAVRPPAEHVVASQPVPRAATPAAVNARDARAPAQEAERVTPPVAVRAKRRVATTDEDAAPWQPLGGSGESGTPAPSPAAAPVPAPSTSGGLTGQSGVVYAAKRKAAAPVVSATPPAPPTPPPAAVEKANPKPQVFKPVPAHVAVKKRPPPQKPATLTTSTSTDAIPSRPPQ